MVDQRQFIISGIGRETIPLNDIGKGATEVLIYTFAITNSGLCRFLELVQPTPGFQLRILSVAEATEKGVLDLVNEKAWLCGSAELRIIDAPSHAKAAIFPDTRAAIFGSFNITRKALATNIEFSTVLVVAPFEALKVFFEQQWRDGSHKPRREELADRVRLLDGPDDLGIEIPAGDRSREGHADQSASTPNERPALVSENAEMIPLFDIEGFLSDLEDVSAKELIDAARAVGMPTRNKLDAHKAIVDCFAQTPAQARDIAMLVLDQIGYVDLGHWTQDVLGLRMPKVDAVPALLKAYAKPRDWRADFASDLVELAGRRDAGAALEAALQLSSTSRRAIVDALARVPEEQVGSALRRVLGFLSAEKLEAWSDELGGASRGLQPTPSSIASYYYEDDEAEEAANDEQFVFTLEEAAQPARNYQLEIVEALKRRRSVGGDRGVFVHVATGGGKTRIANDWIGTHLRGSAQRVLWVTKDWWLLRQAARDFCRRFEGARHQIGRIGGENKSLRFLPEADRSTLVTYTTIHTWEQRGGRRSGGFNVVIIDEAHWGEDGPAYRSLRRAYPDAVFVGLTATPREGAASGWRVLHPRFPFSELVDRGVLARPHPQRRVDTGVRVEAARGLGGEGDFDARTLRQLATSRERNCRIVEEYLSRRGKRTVVFACSTTHADELARLFAREGVLAEPLHSRLGYAEQERTRQRFADGEIEVLVNVACSRTGSTSPRFGACICADRLRATS